ncbi:MAG: S8 family serine peptidase [Candidatus Riflebacteria bacterium]|nr:S8 family serine peptidase [Candidatus Riflebacteria bacterium]
MNRSKSIFFLSFLLICLMFQAGCWFFKDQPTGPGEVSVTLPEKNELADSVQIEFLPGKKNVASTNASIIAATATNPYALFQLVQVNKGCSASPSTTLFQTSQVTNGIASATFKGVPVKTTIAKLSLFNCSRNGCSDFHGTCDLKSGQRNTIFVSPVSEKDSEDISASVIEMIIASSTAFQKVTDGLAEKVKAVIASYTTITPNIYNDVFNSFLELSFPGSGTDLLASETTFVALDNSKVVLSEETKSFVLEDEVLITFKDKPTLEEIRQTELKVGGPVIASFPTLLTYSFRVKATGGNAVINAVNALNDDAYVTKANYTVSAHQIFSGDYIPNDPQYSTNWGIGKIQASDTWEYLPATNVEVAVVDTGARSTHEDLRDVLDKVNGRNFTQQNNGDQNNFEDEHGHGTHVSGIIAASVNNGRGIAGAAPNVRIVPIKCLEKQGDGAVGSIANIAKGIEYASNISNVRVINMSLGAPGPIQPMMKNAIDLAIKKGKLVVVAAGNNNDDASYYSPACYENCFTVAATTKNDSRAYYSNYGAYGAPVDIAAPGDQIYSCGVNSDSSYVYLSGTSMATPFVSALSAALFSVKPALTPNEARALIQQNADPIITDKDIGKRINFLKTINAALGGGILDQPPTVTITGSTTVDPSQVCEFKATAVDPDDTSVTFSWSGNSSSNPVATKNDPKESTATWSAPDKGGKYTIFCKVTDSKNVSGDGSLEVYVKPKPVCINYISPNAGKSGTEVTIAGIAFGAAKGDSIVKFNGSTISDITSWSDTEIKIKIPVGASSASITVTVNSVESNGVKFEIDDTPPSAIFVQTPTNPSNQITATLKVGGDDVVVYKYKLDSVAWGAETTVATPISLSGLSDGEHKIYVIGRDTAGNWQSESGATQFTWVVNTSSPVVTLIGAPSSLTNQVTLNVTVGGTGVVAYKYKLDENAWTTENSVSAAIAFSNLVEGVHTLLVVGRNTAGSWQSDSSPTSATWTIDITPPRAELANAPSGLTSLTNAVIQVGGADVIYYKYSLDGSVMSAETATSTPLTLTGLSQGNHTLHVIGRDQVGNWQLESGATAVTWQIDTSSPVAEMSNAPANPTNQVSGNINVAGTGIVNYKYKLDAGNWGNETQIANPISYSGLSEGPHSISVIGRNSAGTWQSQSSPTTFNWVVDTTPPVASFVTKPTSLSNQANFSFTVGGDGVTVYRYKLDSNAWSGDSTVSSLIDLKNLTDGNHQISIVGRDAAGNWQSNASSTVFSWSLDATPPTAELLNNPINPTTQISAAITVAGTDVAIYKYRLDGGTWSSETAISNPISLSALGQGSHTLSVIGRDSAGNWQNQNTATTYSWAIIPPAPTNVAAAAGNSQVTLSWSAVSGATGYNIYWSTSSGVAPTNGAKIAGIASPFTITGLSNGTTYYYVVTALGANDSESQTSSQVSAIPFSNIPPSVSITNPAQGATIFSGHDVTITANASDDGSITKVEFYQNGLLLFTDTTYPYTYVWSQPPNGSYTITARAYDNLGASKTSSPQSVSVRSIPSICAVTASNDSSYALAYEKTVWAWGNNAEGQLGDGSFDNKITPVQIKGLNNITAISAGDGFCLALQSDGSVWSWGVNDLGQLGMGDLNIQKSNVPLKISNLTNISRISAKWHHALALASDGTVWSWGTLGIFPTPGTLDSNSPIKVQGLPSGIVGISAGYGHCLALTCGGINSTWGWGENRSGELGTSTSFLTIPQKISTTSVSGASFGGFSGGCMCTIFLDESCQMWGCGNNGSGALGNGNTNNQITPTMSFSNPKLNSIYAGYRISFGGDTSGLLWAWGDNSQGQFGDGTTVSSNYPIQITGAPNLNRDGVDLAAGLTHVLALSAGGTSNRKVWSWGKNTYGQLGNGTTNNCFTPKEVVW